MDEFFSWEALKTVAGCASATAIITQFIKQTPFINKIPTQWVSYFISAILLLGATYFTGVLNFSTGALIPFDAIIVALSANGAYSAIQRIAGNKKK